MSTFRLELAREVSNSFSRWRQLDARAVEAGGVLLGKYFPEHALVEVHIVTSPRASDERRRAFFRRQAELHQSVASAVHSGSSGRLGYVGGWHTHPEDDPTPSGLDIRDWRRAVRSDEYSTPGLFFVIVGRVRLRAWFVSAGRRKPEEVRLG